MVILVGVDVGVLLGDLLVVKVEVVVFVVNVLVICC